ncbi:CapA family protein [Patescibacteria group bacterium]|nr:CapA family protein [Patescibacteria group bacterium]
MKNNFYLLLLIMVGIIIACFWLWPVNDDLAGWQADWQLTPKKAEPQQTVLLFGGDVMLARTVEEKMVKYNDWSAPFIDIADQMAQADISFINLESPIYDGGNTTPAGSVVFRALPESIAGLQTAGVDIVTLANNHFADQGTAGMNYTMEILAENNITYCGAGLTSEQSHQAAIMEKNGLKFAYLGYAYPNYNLASESSIGINPMDVGQMRDDVGKASSMADVVIVSMHAGAEYVYTPNSQQIDFAHQAIESGADLVIGHHPHVVQTYEQYQDGHIFYSLGNLIFDQEWSVPTTEGTVVKVVYQGKEITTIEFLPIKTTDYHRATWGNKETTQHVLDRLQIENLIIEI